MPDLLTMAEVEVIQSIAKQGYATSYADVSKMVDTIRALHDCLKSAYTNQIVVLSMLYAVKNAPVGFAMGIATAEIELKYIKKELDAMGGQGGKAQRD